MAVTFDIAKELEDIFKEYNNKVLNPLIIKGLDESEKVLINNLKAGSPVSNKGGIHFRDSWESKPNYKYARYIHNSKKIDYFEKGRGMHQVPLSYILEYAVSSPYKGFINRIRLKSRTAVQQAFINRVKGGL